MLTVTLICNDNCIIAVLPDIVILLYMFMELRIQTEMINTGYYQHHVLRRFGKQFVLYIGNCVAVKVISSNNLMLDYFCNIPNSKK